jgi:hypothetical protein
MNTSLRSALAAALFTTLLPIATSCRQVLGIEERKLEVASPDGGAKASKETACGFAQPSAECASCMRSRCCDESTACEADTACKAAYGCILSCKPGDADCVTWCLGSYARPDALAALTACSAAKCDSQCGHSCGGALVNGSNSCDACVAMNCCQENLDCASDEACVDIDFCSHRCLPAGSLRCATDCGMTYSEASDKSATRSACVAANCSDACSSQQAWGCIESLESHPPVLKPPSLDPITFTMTVVEFLSETPYEGLNVKACSRTDLDCTAPVGTATTDANGAFTLTVPPGPNGFDGYVDLSGSNLYPTLYYFLPPVIVGGTRGKLRLPSSDTITALAGGISVELDTTRGHLAMVPWDCTMSPAPGVSITIDAADEKSTSFYFQNGLPSHAAMQTGSDPALGGAVNLKTGITLVRTKLESAGTVTAAVNFNIRAGTLTAGSIPPSF